MESNYDENLSENCFLQSLIHDHSVIHAKAVQESWIICVPRRGHYHSDSITSDDISAHILIPDSTEPGCAFQTLGDRHVKFKRRLLIVKHEEKIQTSRLLFEETFYADDLSKYTVWCIDKPLTPTTSDFTEDVVIVENLADCMNFLYTSLENKNIFNDIDALIETFEQTNAHIEKEPLSTQRNLVETLYLECLEKILSDPKIQENSESNAYLLRNIKISVESYILYGLRGLLPSAVSANTAMEDAELNKKIKNLHELQLQDLDIRDDIQVSISRGKLELSKLYNSVTVLGKVGCLKKTTRHITEGLKTISTDDLLPILIFIVIRTGLPDWIAQLMFMKQFRFSADDDNANDEVGFLITTLEAAVEHVKSGGLSNCKKIRFLTLENKNNSEETSPTVILNRLFTAVKDVDLEEIEKILSSNKQSRTIQNAKLCHPLCTCEECEKNFTELKLADTSFPNVNSKDERGRTPLQIASIFGHVTVVEFLLIHEADPNEQDNDGLTALHFAASRGHQDTVLLLLHANADPTAFDALGNTPLHLSADNGHTSCAKAILYFSEQRRIPIDPSSANIAGDTPLHYASKWGYMAIVEILLEHRANTRATNRRGQTPLTVAHSTHIIKKLENPNPIVETILQVPLYRNSEIKRISRNDKINSGSIEKNNKADKLLAAINEGDVRLACYYLGLEGPQTKTNESELPNLCHPLCTCEKCAQNDEPIDDNIKRSAIGINIHNSRGETALHVASANGLTDLVQILLDAGANVNAYTSYEHRTPLHIACKNDKIKVVKIFLNCRTSNVNAKDLTGDTPLHLAVKNGNVRIIELLLRHGADVHQRNYNNLSPLELIQEIVAKDVFSSLVYNNIFKIIKSHVAMENMQRKSNI